MPDYCAAAIDVLIGAIVIDSNSSLAIAVALEDNDDDSVIRPDAVELAPIETDDCAGTWYY